MKPLRKTVTANYDDNRCKTRKLISIAVNVFMSKLLLIISVCIVAISYFGAARADVVCLPIEKFTVERSIDRNADLVVIGHEIRRTYYGTYKASNNTSVNHDDGFISIFMIEFVIERVLRGDAHKTGEIMSVVYTVPCQDCERESADTIVFEDAGENDMRQLFKLYPVKEELFEQNAGRVEYINKIHELYDKLKFKFYSTECAIQRIKNRDSETLLDMIFKN